MELDISEANNKESTPVVLFVFNRQIQLEKCLENLKQNNIKLLYIFGDGPRDQEDAKKIKAVKMIIKNIDWADTRVTFRDRNLGLSKSIEEGLNEVFRLHKQAIILEDDICVAPEFYKYMSTALNKYGANKNVAGVTGLRYPFSTKSLGDDPYDVFFTSRFSSWGWGTWERQWKTISFNKSVLNRLQDVSHQKLSSGGADLPYAITELTAGRLTGCWDIYFYINMILDDKYFVWPKANLVTNHGLTEGSHTEGIPPAPWKLKYESKKTKKNTYLLPDGVQINDKINRDFLAFFEASNLDRLPRGYKIKKTYTDIIKLVKKKGSR